MNYRCYIYPTNDTWEAMHEETGEIVQSFCKCMLKEEVNGRYPEGGFYFFETKSGKSAIKLARVRNALRG